MDRSCDSSRATTKTKTHSTDAAALYYARTTTAAEAKNTNNNTDITKALHDAMSIPQLTVVRQAAANNNELLVEDSFTTSTSTMDYDSAATLYNQLLMQQTMESHTDNCLDDQRDDSAVLDVAVSSPLPLPLPLPLPSTLPSTTLPSPSSVSLSSSSSLSYLEDHNEEEQGITCVYHESDHNENELSSYLGGSDNNNNKKKAVNNNNNNNTNNEEGEGDNIVDKGINWENPDPDSDPDAYNDEDDDDDDTDEERDDVCGCMWIVC